MLSRLVLLWCLSSAGPCVSARERLAIMPGGMELLMGAPPELSALADELRWADPNE